MPDRPDGLKLRVADLLRNSLLAADGVLLERSHHPFENNASMRGLRSRSHGEDLQLKAKGLGASPDKMTNLPGS